MADDETTLPVPPTLWEADSVLCGRYRLIAPIGAGGSGTVYRAEDRDTGATVAVKIVAAADEARRARARREHAALRLAQVPGVVKLLGEGEEGVNQILVMELVEGTPFPGPGVTDWPALQPRVEALLRAVGGIHALGIVHRDLKPANVLVDGLGHVTILDLGIARGLDLGPRLTGQGWVLGTPSHMAPEQARGGEVDRRADLYAIGVMVYEALAGAPAFPERQTPRFVAAVRDSPPFEPLPGAPDLVNRLLRRLLAPAPADRPDSVAEVLVALAAPGPTLLPWLGSRRVVDTAVSQLRAGRTTRIGGAAGSGVSRCISEVVLGLREAGVTVVLTEPGQRPLESLRGIAAAGAETPADLEAVLRGRLGRGDVVVISAEGAIDRWSLGLLTRLADVGPILMAVSSGADLELGPLPEGALRALFHGPDRILHLRDDAARVLHARTGGNPARVRDEVDGWVAQGIAAWEGDALRVTRAGLDRVEAGLVPLRLHGTSPTLVEPLDELLGWITLAGRSASPELLHAATGLPTWEIEVELAELRHLGAVRLSPAGHLEAAVPARALDRWSAPTTAAAHRALASSLPPGAPGRLLHLAGADDPEAFVDEALIVAADLLARGRPGQACVALSVALSRNPAGGRRIAIARAVAHAALTEGTPGTLRAVAADLRGVGDLAVAALVHLLTAWAALESGLAEEARVALDDLVSFADEEFAAWHALALVRVALATGVDAAEAEVMRHPFVGAGGRRLKAALGQIRLLQLRPEEAADLSLAAIEGEDNALARATGRVNAGRAFLDAGALDAAEECFLQAAREAAAVRACQVEAFALLGVRSVAWRRGHALEPDTPLLDAVRLLGIPRLRAGAAWSEAGFAWRARAIDQARLLADEAAGAWAECGNERGRTLALALSAACGGGVGDLGSIVASARTLGPRALFVQVAALAAAARWEVDPATRREFQERPPTDEEVSRGVLDREETHRYLHLHHGADIVPPSLSSRL